MHMVTASQRLMWLRNSWITSYRFQALQFTSSFWCHTFILQSLIKRKEETFFISVFSLRSKVDCVGRIAATIVNIVLKQLSSRFLKLKSTKLFITELYTDTFIII